ncbi:ABC transporter substrate-binding protein [Paenibacillus sp. GCM10023252]|uniref:ABC transporter substrate-binding protein n=1 Tax=Paenibacillus sp. GCM10023252 TaxID=3252649 RepID=UPI00360E664D
MQSYERYLELHTRFARAEEPGIAAEVSLDELSSVLHCTQRNVKLIIRRLEEEGLIHWQAGRGRGNRSQLTFLMDREKLLLELSEQLATKGEYKNAFELLQAYGEGTSSRTRFVEWLNGHFGYRSVLHHDSQSDMLRLPVYRPILTLDPGELYYAFSAHLVKQLFDGLVQYDQVKQEVVSGLAHAWEQEEDGKVWTFHLRKGILFHHGRELVAEDVVYSLERLRASKASSWFVRTLDHAEAIGRRTVKLTLNRSNWLLPRFLCAPGMVIVPHDLVEGDPEFWKHPVGTGPFRLAEWTEDRFTLEANSTYYQGRAHLDGVVIVTMPADTSFYSKSWQQLLYDHDPSESEPVQDWQVKEDLCNGCSLLTWNMGKQGPQQSAALRKAFDLLVDRTRLIEMLGEDRKYPARGFQPVGLELLEQRIHPQPEAAAVLLKEAGYAGETIRIGTYGLHEHDARWLQGELASYGVAIEVVAKTWESIRQPEVLGSVDALLYCVVFAEDEVCMIETYEQTGNFLKELLSPELLGWVRGKIDEVLGSKSNEERWKHLRDIESKLREETHVIFLVHKKVDTFYHPSIKGVGVNSLGWIDFREVWMA